MDEFKKYINQNKHQLDVDEPAADLWSRIDQELHRKKAPVIPMIIRWAAAACIIILAGFGTYFLINGRGGKEVLADNRPATETVIDSSTKPSANIAETDLFEENLAEDIVEGRIRRDVKQPRPKEQPTVAVIAEQVEKKPYRRSEDPMYKAFNEMEVGYASMVEIQLEKIKNTPIYAEDANYFHLFKKQFQDLNSDERLLKQETKKSGINEDIISRMINIYQQKIDLLKQLQFEINKMNNRVKSADAQEELQPPTFINL